MTRRPLTSRGWPLRSPLGRVCLGVVLLASPCTTSAQTPAADQALDSASTVTLWLTAGGGFGSRGLTGLLGGTAGVRGWTLGVRYAKTMSGVGALERYTEHHALLIGRTLGSSGRSSIAVGVGEAKAWAVPYTPCRDCWFGDTRKTPATTTAASRSLALAAETHTRPFLGIMAIGVELNAFLSDGASAVGLSFTVPVGLLK